MRKDFPTFTLIFFGLFTETSPEWWKEADLSTFNVPEASN